MGMHDCRVPEECPRSVEQLMDHCLLPLPEQRPSALQVYERLLALQQNPEEAASSPTGSVSPANPAEPASEASSEAFSAHYLPAAQVGQAQAVQGASALRQGSLQNPRRPSSLPSPFAPQLASTPPSEDSSSGSPSPLAYQPPQRLNPGSASTLASPFQQATGTAFSPGRPQSSASASASPFAAQSQQHQHSSALSPFAADVQQNAHPLQTFGLSAIPESTGGYSSTAEPASELPSSVDEPALDNTPQQQQHQQPSINSSRIEPAAGPFLSPGRSPFQSGSRENSAALPAHKKTMSM